MKQVRTPLMLTAGFAALLLSASCKKDKDGNPEPKPDNNNPRQDEVVVVDPAAQHGSVGILKFTYSGKRVEYALVRAKDGKVWMQQNLGSARVAQTVSDAESFGDLYQWGRWSDGHEKRSPAPEVRPASSLNVNNPTGLSASGKNNPYISGWWSTGTATDTWKASAPASVTAANSCDPCKVLGDNWRLPSEEDWRSLIQAEGITNTATGFSSSLRLPAAGWRATSSSSISSAGSSGWYWSSKAHGSNTALGVWIQNSSVQRNYADSRAYGTSVRCVKD